HQTHWAPLLRMQGSISEVKLELVHRDGTTIIPFVLNAIRQEQGGQMVHEIAAYVARDRDKYERELIASRRQLEALVAETQRLHAEAQDRALFAEQMVGIVSHDLRNPLSGIAMGAAVLARGALTDNQQRTLARITRSTDRANRLIGDLLDFTQARLGGGLKVARQAIDLHATVGDAVDELALAYPGRVLQHRRIGDGGCEADPDRLAQLVGNLVANAMTYGTPDRPVTVTSSGDDTTASLSVHNEGTPIPKDVQERIFQPMTRGPHSSPSTGRSVGLGLFIVHQIAQAHGGSSEVRSTAEEGTTFRIQFPRGKI
ncbi:MAG TPA: HAMP domain-containing sensor histidine kinase, partial [Polyangia bacterium]|nr:HAMP domain-containing sensor histidine kinase [Polyangia bacterium]